MGLLSEGTPLSWEETRKLAGHVRKHGLTQFVHQFHKNKDRKNEPLRWGDEIEYMLIDLDEEEKKARVALKSKSSLDKLLAIKDKQTFPSLWGPEYSAYTIESSPGQPYGQTLSDLNYVETSMKQRRAQLMEQLTTRETALTITFFPRLGCPDFTVPATRPTPGRGVTRSLFFPDEAVCQSHPRFKTLSRNIRERRKEKVIINMPVFQDTFTREPYTEEDLASLEDNGEAREAARPGHVYMDAMGFGMGCCCLQMTFQGSSMQEAMAMYDQLIPLTPIMLALSASAPIIRGYLMDVDVRWDIISAAVDCRTREERGQEPLKEDKFVIPKSRFASVSSYLTEGAKKYNDLDLVFDQNICEQLQNEGVPCQLARHVAHLFVRDSVSLFSEKINQDDENETDHFENIQSTNWQNMRFKPPPPNSPISWRVEFRPMDVQVTDFENAAFVVFMILVTRTILSFGLNFLIPISKVDENMATAHRRDAVREGLFYFRKDPLKPVGKVTISDEDMEDEYTLMTVNEVINGKEGEFPGLLPLVQHFLDSTDDLDAETGCTIQQYLKLIEQRASGELMTTARWMRRFVTSHPDYKGDSLVSERINYDLVSAVDKITKGVLQPPELLPNLHLATL